MRYVRTFESFRENKNSKVEPVNEEILGFLKNIFGGMFKKAKELINKTKGGQEVEGIYKKYIKMINDEFSKQAQVDLNITAAGDESKPAEKPATKPEAKTPEAKTPEAKTPETPEAKTPENKEPVVAESKIFEAEEAVDTKLDPAKLKEKKAVLDQILKKMKEMALKEMDAILKKYGGSSSNPQLALIISAKKDQFELDVLNAQIEFLNKAGDKTMIPEITKQRDDVAKKVKETLEKAEKAENVKSTVEIKVGDTVIFKRDAYKDNDGDKRWSELKDEDKKNTESEGIKKMIEDELINVKKVENIEGDLFTFKGKDDKELKKNKSEILIVTNSTEEAKAEEGQAKAEEGQAKAEEK